MWPFWEIFFFGKFREITINFHIFKCKIHYYEDFYLFGVLRRFQHCTGYITTGSWKGRGNQYIEFARVVYCKLPTNGKQLPAFPLKAVTGIEPPTSEVGGESVTTLPPWPPITMKKNVYTYHMKTLGSQWLSVHDHTPYIEFKI